MRRFVLAAACVLVPAAALLLGCGSDRGQQASAAAEDPTGVVSAPNVSDAPQPTTVSRDHQPPPRTPEN